MKQFVYVYFLAPLLSLLVCISSACALPDIIIGNTSSAELAYDAQNLTVSGNLLVTLNNAGTDPLTDSFNVIAYEDVSGNNTYDLGVDTLFGQITVSGPVAASESTTVSIPFSGLQTFSGNIIHLVADLSNQVEEASEDNNTYNTGISSQFIPEPGPLNPGIEWNKRTFEVLPSYNDVMMTPVVIDLDLDGTPEVIFTTFTGGNYVSNGILRAIHGNGGADYFSVDDSTYRIDPGAELAVADIDGDSYPEIIALHQSNRLIAFEHDGQFKWMASVAFPYHIGASLIADLDHDGAPEIIANNYVFDNGGNLLWQGELIERSHLSIAIDLDLDGSQEIVTGKSAYRSNGDIYWTSSLPNSYLASGNFDSDPNPEIVAINRGNLYLLEHDGVVKWGPVSLPGGGGGAPTVADVDSDGMPEIGIAGARYYVVFEADGSIKWQQQTRDASSESTGSSVFDFNGDGSAEIVYGDEVYLRIFDGNTGEVLYRSPKGSGTLFELPTVADVDNDGRAEIIAAANDYAYGGERGIFVYGGLSNNWVSTRKIWNQHAYHITNVNDDGTIPTHQQNNWLIPGFNNFRLNKQLPFVGGDFDAPDLTASYLQVDNSACPAQSTISARIGNGGSATAPAGVKVSFFKVDTLTGERTFFGTGETSKVLTPGDYEDISLPLTLPEAEFVVIEAVADSDELGVGVVNEGFEDNNSHAALLALCLEGGSTTTQVIAQGMIGAVSVYWQEIFQASSYNLYRRTESSEFSLIAANLTDTEYLDTEVVSDVTYYYAVTFTDQNAQESERSGESSATPYGIFCGPDTPPYITSFPVTAISNDGNYHYQVDAFDDDPDDVLTYSLAAAPTGMSINAQTGLITWTPGANTSGIFPVALTVTDKIGRHADQIYKILIAPPHINHPPVILSSPVTEAANNGTYLYNVRAQDPDLGDLVTYSLKSAPTGMTINSTSGLIRWRLTDHASASEPVEVTVTDRAGETDTQDFTIQISENLPPEFDTTPGTSGRRRIQYYYDSNATDPEGKRVTYSLQNPPEGMRINIFSGLVTWTPQDSDIGTHKITILATDSDGLAAPQSFDITVPENSPPEFLSDPTTVGEVGIPYRYDANATDLESLQLTYRKVSGPTSLSVHPETGNITWTPDSAGDVPVKLVVSDEEGLEDTQEFTVDVAPAGSNIDPGISGTPGGDLPPGAPDGEIVSPAPFSTLSKTEEVLVNVTDPDTSDSVPVEWRVELRREGASEGVELGSGTGPAVRALAGKIEPTALSADMYRIWLHMTYGPKTYSKWYPYEITSKLELGVYSTSVTDLEIPLAGIPIQIIRDYKSSDTSKYQFGHGWRLRYPGRVVDNASESPFTAYTAGTRVFVTLPDGRRVGFTFEPYAQSFLFSFLQTPYFRPDPGVFATLEVDQESVTPSGGSYYHFLGGAYNPSKFYLTTRDRIRYTIEEGKGITEIRDANYNSLTFTDSTISHSSGESIKIQRDSNGNITRLSAPGGAVMNYFYNASGDMTSFTDLVGDTWQYTYDDIHRLKTLIDPSGNTLIENFYTAEGQLFRQLDANGNEVKVSVVLDENVEIVTDQNGSSTRREYDNSGNLIKTVDAEGGENNYEYDQNFNLISQIDPNGNSYTWSYDSKGNLTKEVDSLGRETVVESYNNLSQPTKIRYEDGSVYTRQYDARGNLLSATDANGRSTSATYDTAGKLLTLTDPSGATSTLEYNSMGRASKTIDAGGTEKLFTYDASGRISRIESARTDNEGVVHSVVYRYQYDAQGRPIAVTDPNGYTAYVEWTDLNKPAKFTDKRGFVFTYEYDKLGNLTQINYPNGITEVLDYDSAYNRDYRKDREGNEVRYEFDKNHRKTKTIFADGSTEQYEYDSNGNMTKRIDGRRNETLYRYDQANRKRETEDALGGVTRFNYDVFDNQNEFINKLGQITRLTFNSDAKVLQQILPNSLVTSYQYDAVGNMTSEMDADGFETEYEYDDLGRKVKSIDSTGNITTYAYDEMGNLLKATDPLGEVTKWDYDNLGNTIREELPTGEVSEWQYDGNGNVVREDLPSSGVTLHEYDFNNWKVKSTDAKNKVTLFTYDKNGKITSVTDPNNNKTVFRYDQRGRLKEREDAAGKVTTYAYDRSDNIEEIVDRNNRKKRFEYDALHRVIKEEWSENNVVVRTKQYTYDQGSNIKKAWDELATYEYEYDDNNQRISTRITESNVLPGITRTRSYNNRGLVTSITDSEGSVLSTEYDENGRVVMRALNGGTLSASSFTFKYDDAGNRIEQRGYLSLDDSQPWSTAESELDPSGRTKSRTFSDGADTPLIGEEYVYFPTGLLREIERDGKVFSYDYDATGQLVSASYTGHVSETFDYDDNGNRDGSGYVPGPLNRLIEDDIYSYQYDDEGNMILRDHKTNGTYEEFSYNHDNALEKVVRKTHATDAVILTVEYEYDLYGSRISRSVNGQKEVFVTEGANVWGDYTSTGVKKQHYLFGPEVDEILASHVSNGPRRGYITGNLNTVLGIYAENGQLDSEMSYAAFGSELSSSGTPSRYRYSGREYEEELGLYYNRARMYDPRSGRFLSEDPIGFGGGDANLYRYGFNSPTNFSDPTGFTAFSENTAIDTSVSRPFIASAATNTGVYSTEVTIALEGVATAAESVTVATELAQTQAYLYAASSSEGAALQLTKVLAVKAFALTAVILSLPQDEEILPDGTVIERASLSLTPTDEFSQEAVAERVRKRRPECDIRNPVPIEEKRGKSKQHCPPFCEYLKNKSCFFSCGEGKALSLAAWGGYPVPGSGTRKQRCFGKVIGKSSSGAPRECVTIIVDSHCRYHGFPSTRMDPSDDG